MKVLNSWVERQIALCLTALLVAPIGAAQTIAPQTTGEVPKDSVTAATATESVAKGKNERIAGVSVTDGSGMLATQTPDQNQNTPRILRQNKKNQRPPLWELRQRPMKDPKVFPPPGHLAPLSRQRNRDVSIHSRFALHSWLGQASQLGLWQRRLWGALAGLSSARASFDNDFGCNNE